MRTQSNIEAIYSVARINYSYMVAKNEINRNRGIGNNNVPTEVANIIEALSNNILSNKDKSILCDALVRRGYAKESTQLYFTEDIYNENFDTI